MDLSTWIKHAHFFITTRRLRWTRIQRRLKYWDEHHLIRECIAPLPFSNKLCGKSFAVFHPLALYCCRPCAARAGKRKSLHLTHGEKL